MSSAQSELAPHSSFTAFFCSSEQAAVMSRSESIGAYLSFILNILPWSVHPNG